jgi:diaminopropionate ammonia-lyase
VRGFFRAHPELTPTPLTPLPSIATAAGIGAASAKDESRRFGLNAFKIAGVRYAMHQLQGALTPGGVVCATAGNHGRAVARAARERGIACTVFIPAAVSPTASEQQVRSQRIRAMREDGADVVEVDGSYEAAVTRAAEHAVASGATMVSDTAWPGARGTAGERIPHWIMAGYTRLFEEAAAQWDTVPDVVLIQGGVGGLVCAAASWFAAHFGASRPFLIACEPTNAACLLTSARAGELTTLDGPLKTMMAGLRCATPSAAAWPTILRGIDAFMTVSDEQVATTMAMLERSEGIAAGPSGACGAAALVALGTSPLLAPLRESCRLDRSTRALVVITEGA